MIVFETKFNENVTTNINKHTMKKISWVYVLTSALFIFLGVMDVVGGNNFGWGLIVFGVLFFPLCFLLTKIIQKNLNKTMTILSDNTQEKYVFDDKKFYIEQIKGENYKGTTEATYDYFFKVEETKTHYFLYISKHQAHVVPKEDIIQGTIEECNHLLSYNLGPKFKQYKK